MIETIKKIVAPLSRKISLMMSRCVINIVDDSSPTQNAQIECFQDEVFDDAEVWQHFGFSSNPPRGTEGVALFPGGERQSPLIIATENKDKRPLNLEEGESCVYSSCGDSFALKVENKAELQTKSFSIQTNKISIQNDSCELIDLLSQLCDLLSKDKTNTLLGPQPLLGSPQYALLKSKIDSFKNSSKAASSYGTQ
jgi:phage gp45-like